MINNFAVLDNHFNIISASPDFFRFIGPTHFSSLLNAVHPDDRDEFMRLNNESAESEKTEMFIRMKNAANSYREVYISLRPKTAKHQNTDNQTIIEMVDIKARIALLRDMEYENYVLRTLLGMHNSIIFTYNTQTDEFYEYAVDKNRNYDIFKGSIEEWQNWMISQNIVCSEQIPLFEQICENIKNCKSGFEHNILLGTGNDNSGYCSYKIRAKVNHIDNSTAHIAGEILAENNTVINNVSPYRHDPMTGLLDKTSIVRYAKDKIAENGKDGVVIAMIDLDNFKSVNDTLGHSMGDDVIIRFTEILSSIIGNFGAVGRYGGDEFMAVLTKGNTEDELRNMFRSIRTTAQSEFHKIEGSKISVTCSIGSAAYPADGKSYKDVFELADTCVYIAKEYGKNRYIIYCDKVQDVIDTDEMLWEGRNTRAEGNGDLTFRLTSMLFSDGGAEIPNVLEKLGTYYNLTYIRIYTGKEMNLETSWTIATDTTADNAKYVFNNDYIEKFNLNGIYRIDNIKKLEKMFPDAYESLKSRNVDSAVQYLITDAEDIKGLISFEQIKPATHYWHESEVNNYALIGKLIGQMLIRKR